MNRLTTLFASDKNNLLNIYITCGYPKLDSLPEIIEALEEEGVDMIEIGMPYSDPLADGPTIQETSSVALKNGMTMSTMFEQVKKARSQSALPFVYMGYLNQLVQYGIDKFLDQAVSAGIDGLIIPDLPADIYHEELQPKIEASGLNMVFLITPQTSDERIREIDQNTSGFIYMVSSNSITGKEEDLHTQQERYFQRISGMGLESPLMIGFGIHNRETYEMACRYARGAIVGSAFLKAIDPNHVSRSAKNFVKTLRS